jgi:hypothetical protein
MGLTALVLFVVSALLTSAARYHAIHIISEEGEPANVGADTGINAVSGSVLEAASPPPPPALWWFAPFWSSSGFGSEALSIITALVDSGALNESDLWLTHAGAHAHARSQPRHMPAARMPQAA